MRPSGTVCKRSCGKATRWPAGSGRDAAELDRARRWRRFWTSLASRAAAAGRRRRRPGADTLGGQRPRAAGALSVPRRAVRKVVSLAGARGPPLQRSRVPAADRARAAAGARAQRSSEEMLLFYEAVTRATRRLWLSYPALDEAAAAALAQPVFAGSRAGVRGGADRAERADRSEPRAARRRAASRRPSFASRRWPRPWRGTCRCWPGCSRGQSTADLPQSLAAADGQSVTDVLCLPATSCARNAKGSARPKECSPARRRALGGRFFPQRTFSATELEQYAACPFRYFLAKVVERRAESRSWRWKSIIWSGAGWRMN